MGEDNGYAPREALLGRFVRRFADVYVRLGKFRIRSVNESERARLEASFKDKQGQISLNKSLDLNCRIVVLGVDDGHGNQLYANADIEQLRLQDSADINELATAIGEFWAFGRESAEEAKKNLAATTTDS